MARKKTTFPNNDIDTTGYGFAKISANGTAPESRVPTANDAFTIAWNLQLDDTGRDRKRSRIYKAYKRFPPTDYSMVAAKGLNGLSNVNFGQLEFIVDNQKSSFYDMVTERNLSATIITKEGGPKEKKEWSELISIGWDRILRKWKSYLYNVEQDLEEMLLYGKGFEIAEDRSGWLTKSFHNSEILVPDRTFADLSNLGELVIKRSYTPLEFWRKVTGGNKEEEKAREYAESLGYNFWACVDAMRLHTTNYQTKQTCSQWLRDVASGNFNLSRLYSHTIQVYELYVREFNNSVSKMMVLQDYSQVSQGYRNSGIRDMTDEIYLNGAGFLYYKKNWVKAQENVWSEIIVPFTDSVGSGYWHEIKGLAERVFVQCRQYDINMNRIMDAMNIQMMLMLKGGSADATKKLKQMQFEPWFILPEDVEPQQVRLQLPFGDVLQGIQFYQSDMYRGIGAYRINEPTNRGGQRTLGEAQLDAAESAKLTGTQVKRYNSCHTEWNRQLFKRMTETKAGGCGYELKEEFEEFLEENKVPKDAWAWENIELIESNMLNGAGSPSFKMMAAQKTVEILNMTPMSEGQYEAMRDYIASLQGRQNVDRYLPRNSGDIPDQARVIAFENAGMSDPLANSENFRVFPNDNHVEHFKGHFSDSMLACDKAAAMIQSGQPDAKTLADIVVCLLTLKGPHMVAHLQYIERDPSKKDIFKQFQQSLSVLQGRVDEISQVAQELASQDQQQAQGMSEEDLKIQAKAAEAAIKLDYEQKRGDIKIANIATQHELRQEIQKEKAATDLAIKRAKANVDALIKKKENPEPPESTR